MVSDSQNRLSHETINSVEFPDKIFLISQADKPKEVKEILLKSAISNGWISMLVNINTAMFAGLISLTADFNPLHSFIFLIAQFVTTFIGSIIILFLQIRQQNNKAIPMKVSEGMLTFVDLFVMLGWGLGVLVFLSPETYQLSLLIIVMLAAAGIGAATLNSRLLPSLIFGRIFLFLPAIIYCLIEQPPFWGLLICTLLFATIVSIGIGYAVHVQHLNEANYGLKLREVSVQLEQQSFSLEKTLLSKHESQTKLLKETKLRERFLHSINHDLNQPLSALSLYLNALQTDIDGDARATVTASQECLLSAKTLIQGMSQLAWIGEHLPAPKISSVKLQPLMQQIATDTKLLAAEKEVEITCVPTSVSVRTDRDYLERVLRNLVHNAIQYSNKGRIVIGVRHRPDDFIEIMIADNGLGISKEHQKNIFDEFYQIDIHTSRRVGNIGLGLSIVKDLVNALNGCVTLKAEKDRGTVFGVLLPRDYQQITSIDEEPSQQFKRVLLMEDQQEYLIAISSMLEAEGFETQTASSSQEIASVDCNLLDGIDYLVLDYNLNDTLTAFDILKRSEENLFPKTLIISQYDNPDMIFKVKEKGGRFLKKPFSTDSLKAALEALKAKA